jgi:hypothetical protein
VVAGSSPVRVVLQVPRAGGIFAGMAGPTRKIGKLGWLRGLRHAVLHSVDSSSTDSRAAGGFFSALIASEGILVTAGFPSATRLAVTHLKMTRGGWGVAISSAADAFRVIDLETTGLNPREHEASQ